MIYRDRWQTTAGQRREQEKEEKVVIRLRDLDSGRGSIFKESKTESGTATCTIPMLILLVGAAHGALSGQLAAGWLDGPVACIAKKEESWSKTDGGDRRC